MIQGSDRFLVEHICSHSRQRPDLLVGKLLNNFRILDKPGIDRIDSGNIRPVLIDIGTNRPSEDACGNIAAPAAEGFDNTLTVAA